MITLENIRKKLQEGIRQGGLSQAELAHRLGIVQQTVSEYLRGKAMPALDTFAKLCAVLDLDANEILCVSEFETEN